MITLSKYSKSFLFILILFNPDIFLSQEKFMDISNITFPKDIALDYTSKISFKRHLNYRTNFLLREISKDRLDSIEMRKNKLYNPHIDKKYWNEDEVLAANYLVKISANDFDFSFMDYNKPQDFGNILVNKNDSIFLPKKWIRVLKNESIESIWLKGYARIDSDGYPLNKNDYYTPIYLKTENKLFKIITELDKSHSVEYLMELSYSGMVLRDCYTTKNITAKFAKVLEKNVIKGLEKNPILAELYSDLALPKDEVWMKRRHKKSMVLGQPYFEVSGYIINIDTDIYGVRCYISHSLNKAVGVKGIYQESTSKEFEKYQDIIQMVVLSSTKRTCKELNLTFEDNYCKCKNNGN